MKVSKLIHIMQENWGYNAGTRRETDVYLQL